eukprot:CFRG6318T1
MVGRPQAGVRMHTTETETKTACVYCDTQYAKRTSAARWEEHLAYCEKAPTDVNIEFRVKNNLDETPGKRKRGQQHKDMDDVMGGVLALSDPMKKSKKGSHFSSNAKTVRPHEALLPKGWQTMVTDWLKEDAPTFDYGGFVVGTKAEEASLYCKAKGVLAGVPFFDEVFRQCHCLVKWEYSEGDYLDPTEFPGGRFVVAKVRGAARDLLMGERVALNMIARASGIATLARKLSEIKRLHEWKGVVAGTRKTTPGFRTVEKYAMLIGGCDTHRMDLSSMVMLKDNHIWSQGSISLAVRKAKSVSGFSLKIEVECQSIDEAREAFNSGADIAMLDNFTPVALTAAAATLKAEYPHRLIEASGGITEQSIANYFCKDVDIISLGSLTQGVSFVDFSLKISPPGR